MQEFDRGPGVLVALHGHGDDPSSARKWGRQIAPASWEVVAPGAARDADGTRSWFDTGPRGVAVDDLARAAAKVGDLVDRVHRRGDRVVVAGFSQGGAVALSLGLFGIEPDAVVSVCGFYPELEREPEHDAVSTAAPTLVVGASEDADVPAFMSDDAAALLRSLGASVTSTTVSGGHSVSESAVDATATWLAETLRSAISVSLGLPVDRVESGPELVSGDAVAELAAGYERLGFHACYVTDHPAPDDRWLAGGGHQALEPTVALAVAAAHTRRLLLHTNVYVLPYRNPFLAAKALSSVDVLSGGRLIAGVAAGYLRPEFQALGVDFDSRGRRLEEALQVLPRIWTESSLELAGDGFEARAVTSLPRPVRRPHPPLWVGGNSPAAVRRAVSYAQGWCPFPTPAGSGRALRTSEIVDLDSLELRLHDVRQRCEELQRPPLTICFVPFSLGTYLADPDTLGDMVAEIDRLRAMGVDWVALSVPGTTRAEVHRHAAELASALGLG